MSHVASVDLFVTDLDALESACVALGLELIRGATTYQWFGTWMADYGDATRAAALKGHDPQKFGQCEHKIRVKGAPGTVYEVGLVRRLDGKAGYDLLYDNWCRGCGLEEVAGKDLVRLKDEYGYATTAKVLTKKGYKVARASDAKGRLQCVGTKY